MALQPVNGNRLSTADADVLRLLEGRHHDPFAVLGRHADGNAASLRVLVPRCRNVWIGNRRRPARRVGDTDLFEYIDRTGGLPRHYKVIAERDDGRVVDRHDPYTFGPLTDDADLRAFNAGRHRRAQTFLGANQRVIDGIAGTQFAVWAPNARRVSVVGDFNDWDGRCHPLRSRGDSGVWELFVPGVHSGAYKFELLQRETDELLLRADPYAQCAELRPATASVVWAAEPYAWSDASWLAARQARDWRSLPLSIYEVHLGSWRRNRDGSFLTYRELAEQLCAHVRQLGFTHIELLPITEHPLDESWGYQVSGYFAPTSRYGTPDDFRYFVDYFHRHGIGVILDWVPAHFPRDAHALANFDGQSLYEYHDSWKAEHRDWGTLVFNYERNEVMSFLISSALYWLQEFHLDGLRVDAVASMLHLNFSRQGEQWVPNRFGGNQNLEAIDFICELNNAAAEACPDCLMIAEESTDWPGVTGPTSQGGLGFHMKWNMGWMHDTLKYFAKDPIYRKYHQDWLTFGPTYAFDEQFLLPLSHDEVVHLKRSLLCKMPGDDWQRHANLRLLLAYQWSFPGKQLLFMGGELAQQGEWNVGAQLEWERSDNAGIPQLLADLNRLQASVPALNAWDFDARGFEWIDGEDRERSIIAYLRRAADSAAVVILNFTPVVRHDYQVGVPSPGSYLEVFNSDNDRYGGSGVLNAGQIVAAADARHGLAFSIRLTLPPLAGVILVQGQRATRLANQPGSQCH